jgi:lipid II:glycine glycyltransferase (peptidoglycan interpeptide bridge formation enzyme)
MNKTSERRDFVDRPLSYYEAIYDTFHESGQVKFMIATLDSKNLVETMNEKVMQEQATYNRLTQRKQAYPEIFKDEGKLSDTILKLDSAKMRLKQASDLKEEYGEVIDLTVNMDFIWGNEIVSLYGGNEKALLKFGSQYYMQWQMIQKAMDLGYQRYNFYGIPNDLKSEDPMYGVFETKKGFNGQVEHLIGEFDYIISPSKFKMYQILSDLFFKLRDK